MKRVNLGFDECKPHWAANHGFKEALERLGMRDVLITGDFDTKRTDIYGNIDCSVAEFQQRLNDDPGLREGSLCEVRPKYVEVDCDICSSCGEHSGYTRDEDGETVSDCCAASPVDVDEDYGSDR